MAKKKQVPRGIRNNNPLNIRRSDNKWKGRVACPTDKDFEQFTDMRYGIRAAYINMRTIIRRNPFCTLQKLINVWAPPVENDTDAYVERVAKLTGISPSSVIDGHDCGHMIPIAYAMAQVECGKKLEYGMFVTAWDWI